MNAFIFLMIAKQNILKLQQRKWQWKSWKHELVLRYAGIEGKRAKKSEQALDCPFHLAETEDISQDQVPPQLPPADNWSFSIYFSGGNFATTRAFTENRT